MPTSPQYAFDPTGTLAANFVQNEQQVLTAVNWRDFHFIVPTFAPFFLNSLQISFTDSTGTSRPLTMGVDWYACFEFIAASRACAAPIFGGIQFLDTQLSGVVTISYQTLGGTWVQDEATIAEILADTLHNPRTTAWDVVTNQPVTFPVIDHEWDLVDMVGLSGLITEMQNIEQAIRDASSGGLSSHITDYNNPHHVTATQVGLGNVQNYPIASLADAQAGVSNAEYMTPYLVAAVINSSSGAAIIAHINNTNNPHQTTAAQVGTYSSSQLDTMLAAKLNANTAAVDTNAFDGKSATDFKSWVLTGTANDSLLFNGLTPDEFATQVLTGTAANSNQLGGQSLSQLTTQMNTIAQNAANAVSATNTSPYYSKDLSETGQTAGTYYSLLGILKVPTIGTDNLTLFPDAYWFVNAGSTDQSNSNAEYLVRTSVTGPSGNQFSMSVRNMSDIKPIGVGFGYQQINYDYDGTGTNVPCVLVYMSHPENRSNFGSIELMKSDNSKLVSNTSLATLPTGFVTITDDPFVTSSQLASAIETIVASINAAATTVN